MTAFVGIAVTTLLVVAVTAVRGRRNSGPGVATPARLGATGFALAAIAATTLNGVGSGGSFNWRIGTDSLIGWRSDLAEFPDTVQSVLLVGNVVVYIPFGICVALAWPRRPITALFAALLVPVTVEILQAFVLRGVGSADDALLNCIGVAVGWSLGMLAHALSSSRARRQVR